MGAKYDSLWHLNRLKTFSASATSWPQLFHPLRGRRLANGRGAGNNCFSFALCLWGLHVDADSSLGHPIHVVGILTQGYPCEASRFLLVTSFCPPPPQEGKRASLCSAPLQLGDRYSPPSGTHGTTFAALAVTTHPQTCMGSPACESSFLVETETWRRAGTKPSGEARARSRC